ncbi:MAG: type I phosphomannose isomerase catalytic subunit [Candidatus Velthaea sp.]
MTATTQLLYPYLLEPQEKAAIWGGDALVARYGKHADPQAAIGESWECWDENRVENGPFAGRTLGDVRHRLGAELMGPLDGAARFPLLTKIIDAREALSVQVHPDDAYAQRVEHQANGKTECWHILAAQPDAHLVLGWNRDTSRAEYERRVADGSLGEILRRVPARAGETYYLPAGTLHAIGAGIQLFEAQQASDLTYRIFDWNRVGADGRPRELHVAKAADVLDFRATTRVAAAPLIFREPGLERSLLVGAARFSLERIDADGTAPVRIPTHGVPFTLTALAAPLSVETDGVRAAVAPYATIVVPAAAEALVVSSGGAMFVVRPQPQLEQVRADARRAGVADSAVDAFFAQFV